MRKILGLTILVLVLSVLLGSYAGVFAQEQTDEYAVAFASYPEVPNQYDVQVYNRTTGEQVFLTTIDNVNVDHYHSYQVVNGNLYVLKEVGDTSGDDWMHELWKYTAGGSQLLFSSKGLDFRVAPNESWVAMVYPLPPDYFWSGLGFLDLAGGELFHEENFQNVSEEFSLGLGQWADDSSTIWVNFHRGPSPSLLGKVTISDWVATVYDPGDVSIGSDYKIEPNTGQVLFSDHPVFFDVMSAQEFRDSGDPVSLYLYNLDSAVQLKIAESAAKPFDPYWITDNFFAYKDPAGDGNTYLTYTILSGEIKPLETPPSDVYPRMISANFEFNMPALVPSSVPPIFPAEFPVDEGLPEIYPFITSIGDGFFELSLDYGEDCHGAGACHYGSMLAKKTSSDFPQGSETMPVNIWGGERVILDKGIQGYYIEGGCGASCSDSMVAWIYDGYEYVLGLQGGPEDAVVALANAAIVNSLP